MKESFSVQVKDFHLDHIFDCGQCFRWNREADGSYVGIAGGQVVRMSFEPTIADSGKILPTEGILIIEGANEEGFQNFWYDYLDLGRDYGRIKRSLGRGDGAMRKAIRAGAGIRILNQDLWEIMVSFIISQNNNIPRIKGCIESLCREFGEPVNVPEFIFDTAPAWYDIPSPQVLASLRREDLECCRLGYRGPYLIETAKEVSERGGIAEVEKQLTQAEDPIEALQEFTGIGPKVASCIALFGAGRHDAFPIDVWMRRAMHTVYDIDEKNVKAMQAYAEEHFGRYGGFAQQYLFYYIRGIQG